MCMWQRGDVISMDKQEPPPPAPAISTPWVRTFRPLLLLQTECTLAAPSVSPAPCT